MMRRLYEVNKGVRGALCAGILFLGAVGSAGADTGMLIENEFVAGQCGTKVRTGGTVTFADENGDGKIDYAGRYTFRDTYDLLSVLWLGISKFSDRNCDSDLRHYLAERWKEEFAYHRICMDRPCSAIHHLFRPGDDVAHTAAFLDTLGISRDPEDAFCNGSDADDLDPIRRPCTDDEQVCGLDGTFGLVLPITEASAETSVEPCEKGKFDWFPVPFAMRPSCEDGAPSILGLCLGPLDANGDAGCVTGQGDYSMFTPLGYDTRAFNRVVRDAEGTVVVGSNSKDLIGAFY